MMSEWRIHWNIMDSGKEIVEADTKEEARKVFDRAMYDFPQDSEENEFRYFSPRWLNEIAKGLTAGAKKHPRETWRTIPCVEHLCRAMRHIVLYLMGDRGEPHLINASMRLMMAFETEATELSREQWEGLMRKRGMA